MIKNNKFKICILGAGFGGISTLANLKELSKQKDVEITLISNKNYFLFTPLLHEVATGEVRPYNVIYPIEKLKLNLFNFKFIEDLVINIDFDKKFVKTSNSDVYYDYLVIGLGSVTNFYNIESVKKNALTLRTLEDAVKIRKHISNSLSKANKESDLELKRKLSSFVISGAGATGVELVGSLFDFIQYKIRNLDNLNIKDINIYLVELQDKVLAELKDKNFSQKSKKHLESLGIKLFLNKRVLNFDGDKVEILDINSNEIFNIDTVNFIWTSGVKVPRIIENLKVKKDLKGRLLINKYLNLVEYNNVFALGDNAVIENEINLTTAQNAIQQAKILAYNLSAKKYFFQFSKEFKYNHLGNLITIGKNFAINDISGFEIDGSFAWVLWKFIHLIKLMGLENQFSVLFDWIRTLCYKRYE